MTPETAVDKTLGRLMMLHEFLPDVTEFCFKVLKYIVITNGEKKKDI